jgi:hypothetical protein
MAILEAHSNDYFKSYRGVLNFTNNPSVSAKDSRRLIINRLRSSNPNLRLPVFYLAMLKLDIEDDQQTINQIIAKWDNHSKIQAKKYINELILEKPLKQQLNANLK